MNRHQRESGQLAALAFLCVLGIALLILYLLVE